MVDVNNARALSQQERLAERAIQKAAAMGNFNQKDYPVNPIEYMYDRGIENIFRFILTHPDMDHMDGILDVWERFEPPNFWDTANVCDKDNDEWTKSPYREEDWKHYSRLRSGRSNSKRLVYYSGQPQCDFWRDDGITILSPTPELVDKANVEGDWNDSSYVLLYKVGRNGADPWKVIFSGDSHDDSWDHILDVHASDVSNIDLLLAPHHGRHSDRDFSFLDVLRPKLTLFGNAPSEHLAYGPWNSRKLPLITNNQAGSLIVCFYDNYVHVFSTNRKYAETVQGPDPCYLETLGAWHCESIS